MSENRKLTIARDTVIYMLAKAVEAVLGFVTLKAYTSYFDTTLYGRYDLVNKCVLIIGPICMLWLQHGVTRYVNTYEAKGEGKSFYSTVFFTWLTIALAVLVIGGAGLALVTGAFAHVEGVARFLTDYRPDWLWLALLCIVTYGAGQLVAAIAGARRRISLSLFISLFSATMKLLIPVALSQTYGARVEWILIAWIFCDLVAALFGSIRLGIWRQVSLSAYSRPLLTLLLAFGVPLIGNFITTTVLNNSDRFLIASFADASQNGVYAANYAIAAAAVTTLTMGASRGSYPNILKAWSVKDEALTVALISQAVRLFLLITLPAVVGLAVLSPRVAALALDEAYHGGALVIPFVGFGLMLLGLTEYSNKHWELSANTKVIFRNSAISGAVNILLNIGLLPRFGYMAAAVSTFLGFLVYFLLSKLGSHKYIRWTIPWQTYARIFAAAAAMGAGVLALSVALPAAWYWFPVLVAAGVGIYSVILAVTGELAGEWQFLRNKLSAIMGKQKQSK